MAVSLLRRLAADAPVPVFVVQGRGARGAVALLRIDERVEIVDSPRHATVLLVVGEVPADHAPALRQLHDQLPHPRVALWWTSDDLGPSARETLPPAQIVSADAADAIRDLHRGLLLGDRGTTMELGPEQNPTEWQGVGPHGQGGEGMMGGTPYGRSMAMTGEDIRDGLQLDRVPVTLGPYHGALPAGLTLDLELQGDVIVTCAVRRPDAEGFGGGLPVDTRTDRRVLWVADLLRVHGLGDRATRLLRTATHGRDPADLIRRARRSLYGSLAGVGTIDGRDGLARFDAIAAGEDPLDGRTLGTVLSEHLPGMEWSAAITTVWTLDPAPLEQTVGVPT